MQLSAGIRQITPFKCAQMRQAKSNFVLSATLRDDHYCSDAFHKKHPATICRDPDLSCGPGDSSHYLQTEDRGFLAYFMVKSALHKTAFGHFCSAPCFLSVQLTGACRRPPAISFVLEFKLAEFCLLRISIVSELACHLLDSLLLLA